jgi:hypothetical protein
MSGVKRLRLTADAVEATDREPPSRDRARPAAG